MDEELTIPADCYDDSGLSDPGIANPLQPVTPSPPPPASGCYDRSGCSGAVVVVV
jgi:hypothetical protein